jgi:hypothetical protein
MKQGLSKATVVLMLLSLAWSCSSTQTTTSKKDVVPLAINIHSEKDLELESVNWDFYKINLIRSLKQNQYVDLRLVESDENPELVLDVEIKNFNISPNSESKQRQIYSRTVEAGIDSKGKPIYQKVSAAVDYTHSTIRSNANLFTRLTWKQKSQDIFSKRFSANYTYRNTEVGTISGDHRAVDGSVYKMTAITHPTADSFLWSLSQQEMTRRISEELRHNLRRKD